MSNFFPIMFCTVKLLYILKAVCFGMEFHHLNKIFDVTWPHLNCWKFFGGRFWCSNEIEVYVVCFKCSTYSCKFVHGS